MLDPRGYGPLLRLEIASHRLLRYAHAVPARRRFASNLRCSARAALPDRRSPPSSACWPARAPAARAAPRPLRIARYYVLITASIAAGLWDRLRNGTPAGWEKAEGTR